MRLSIIIPVYGDASALPELLHRLFAMADKAAYQTELVMIDDGSVDAVWEAMKRSCSCHRQREIRLIRLAHNHGQHVATLCGLLHSSFDTIVTLDADLQHPPEAIPSLLEKLSTQELELVYGKTSSGHSWGRRVISTSYKNLASLFGAAFRHTSSFRALQRQVIHRLESLITERTFSLDDCLHEVVRKVGYVAIAHQKRKHGQSSYTWTRLVIVALKTSYHSRRLQTATTRLGVLLIGISLANMILAFRLLSPGGTAALFIVAAMAMLSSYLITKRRKKRPLGEQFHIRELIADTIDSGAVKAD